MKYFLITIILLVSVNLFSQQDTLYFPVTHHIITLDNGTGGQDAALIPLIMYELNNAFAPAGIQFYMSCVGIDTIKNTTKTSIDLRNGVYTDRDYLTNIASVPNTINIFYPHIIYYGSSSAIGVATFPWASDDYITVVRTQSIYNFGTFDNFIKEFSHHIHEMGHYFGLQHTFLNYNNSWAEHPTDRIYCATRGDSLCDTPADIEVSRTFGYYENYTDSNNCSLCNLLLDSFYYSPNGWWYKPDLKNYMNYASVYCREYFSDQQNTKMRNMATNRTKLINKIGNPNYVTLKTIKIG